MSNEVLLQTSSVGGTVLGGRLKRKEGLRVSHRDLILIANVVSGHDTNQQLVTHAHRERSVNKQ